MYYTLEFKNFIWLVEIMLQFLKSFKFHKLSCSCRSIANASLNLPKDVLEGQAHFWLSNVNWPAQSSCWRWARSGKSWPNTFINCSCGVYRKIVFPAQFAKLTNCYFFSLVPLCLLSCKKLTNALSVSIPLPSLCWNPACSAFIVYDAKIFVATHWQNISSEIRTQVYRTVSG